jgi:sialate O-acetylesterase
MKSFALAAVLVLAGVVPATAQDLLAAPFSDHGVIQRDRPIAVWGQAEPGQAVTVELAGRTVQAEAGRDGRWRAQVPALPAGGPHVLTARAGDRTERAEDILVGDVFLCSGQSNMVLQVNRALNSPREIASSADDQIRLMTVPTEHRPTPQTEFVSPVSWAAAAPATVADFSAACFFFAQDLRRDHDVPMGLINASWGGSMIQAWMSADAVRAQGGYDDALSILEQFPVDPTAARTRWGRQWEAWWEAKAGTRPWTEATTDWNPVPAMVAWELWGVPELAAYNGMVWYGTDVTLAAAQAAGGATVTLGNVDEADQTWVNGVAVGASGSGDRVYPILPGVLKRGANTIIINVLDTYANGGLYGPAEKRALVLGDGTSIPLDEAGWRYRIGAGDFGPPPRAPWEALAGIATISNAMIAPLEGYGLKGVLWYQGESNAARDPELYDRRLAGWMADWRARFDRPDLPFLIVSLANYGEPISAPAPSGWAELRDRTRTAVLADDRAALAVAIDLGDRWDIHPGQKLELGRRLARAARAEIYGADIAASGPEAARARRDGPSVLVEFEHVEGALVAYGAASLLGFELCGANGSDCRYAEARPEGRAVRITVPAGAQAEQVRYAWADNPPVNLFDGAGLPAGPFRLTVD